MIVRANTIRPTAKDILALRSSLLRLQLLPDDAVYFYSQTDEYAVFSNFVPYGVAMAGVYWPSVEHYFPAQKFDDAGYRDRIRRAGRPKDATALGMTRLHPLRSDWETAKDGVMLDAVRVKFHTHEKPAQLPLSTGARLILENASMDSYWGCGPDGSGLNKLGNILMKVREGLQRSPLRF